MNNFKFSPSSTVYKDMLSFELSHWWYKSLRDLLLREIRKLDVKRILDVGFGTGANLEFFKKEGYETFGVDISDEAIEIAKSKGLSGIKKGNIVSIPFENNSFDLVTCMDIYGNLNPLESKEASLEVNRVCKEGGYVIINTSALPWMYSLHDMAWDIKQRYYLSNLINILEASNFRILRATYRVSLLFPLIFLVRYAEKFSKNKVARGDTHKTNFLLNFIFYKVMNIENFLLKIMNLPLGNSVFIIAQKK